MLPSIMILASLLATGGGWTTLVVDAVATSEGKFMGAGKAFG